MRRKLLFERLHLGPLLVRQLAGRCSSLELRQACLSCVELIGAHQRPADRLVMRRQLTLERLHLLALLIRQLAGCCSSLELCETCLRCVELIGTHHRCLVMRRELLLERLHLGALLIRQLAGRRAPLELRQPRLGRTELVGAHHVRVCHLDPRWPSPGSRARVP